MAFKSKKKYRYLYADWNVVILKFVNVLFLFILTGLCLFLTRVVLKGKNIEFLSYIIQEQNIKF